MEIYATKSLYFLINIEYTFAVEVESPLLIKENSINEKENCVSKPKP